MSSIAEIAQAFWEYSNRTLRARMLQKNSVIDDAYENYGSISTYMAVPTSVNAMQTFHHNAGIATQANLTLWIQRSDAAIAASYLSSNIVNLTVGVPDHTSILSTATYPMMNISFRRYNPITFDFNIPTQLNVGTYGFIINSFSGMTTDSIPNIGLTTDSLYYDTYKRTTTNTEITNLTIPFEFHAVGDFVTDTIGTNDPDEPKEPILVAAQTFTNTSIHSLSGINLFMSKDALGPEVPLTFKLCNVDINGLPDTTSVIYTVNFNSLWVTGIGGKGDGQYVTIDTSASPIPLIVDKKYAFVVEVGSESKNIYWWSSNTIDPLGEAFDYVDSAWAVLDYDRAYTLDATIDVANPERESQPSNIACDELMGKWSGEKEAVVSILIDNTGSMVTNDPGRDRYDTVSAFIENISTKLKNRVTFDVSQFACMDEALADTSSFRGYTPKMYKRTLNTNGDLVNTSYSMSSILGESSNMTKDVDLLTSYLSHIKDGIYVSSGATPITTAISLAMERIEEQNVTNGKTYGKEKIIIIFTDGGENVPPQSISGIGSLANKVCKKIKDNNIKLYFITLNVATPNRSLYWYALDNSVYTKYKGYFTGFYTPSTPYDVYRRDYTEFGHGLAMQITYKNATGVETTLPAAMNQDMNNKVLLESNPNMLIQMFEIPSNTTYRSISKITLFLEGDSYTNDNALSVNMVVFKNPNGDPVMPNTEFYPYTFTLNSSIPNKIVIPTNIPISTGDGSYTPANRYCVKLSTASTDSAMIDFVIKAQIAIATAVTNIAGGKVFVSQDIESLSEVFDYIISSGQWLYENFSAIQYFGDEDVDVVSLKLGIVLTTDVNMYYTVDYKASYDLEWISWNGGQHILPTSEDKDVDVEFVAMWIRYNVFFE